MVLVVEEEDGVRELYAAQLAEAGFMVLEAPDGSTAVEKALQFVPHAIVLDLVLPGIDGLKVVRRLRADERTQAVAIVAFAALNAPDGAGGSGLGTLAIAAGCDSFFSKPVAPATIIREVLLLVARQSRNAPGRGRATK
jgi:CheY-like chemotaxis protein